MMRQFRNAGLYFFTTFLVTCLAHEAAGGGSRVMQSQRKIPVIASVDVVVVGGTSAGVAAAESAARSGAKVFLAAPRPYLGEDMCATLRLELKDGRSPSTPLAKKLFSKGPATTPGHVKATLAETLLDAGVEFRYGSYVTDVLRDGSKNPCGVVIANRGGRQAIVAKVIVDATDYAWVCRRAGCQLSPWPGGKVRFERTVLQRSGKKGKGKVHAFEIDMRDFSFASLAKAEHAARDMTPADGLLRGAESLFCTPPVRILCRKSGDGSLASFQPKGQERLYVLGGCADIPRERATALLQPAGMTGIGAEIGLAAAAQAKALPRPCGAHLPGKEATAASKGDIREILSGGRSVERKKGPTVPSSDASLGILASVDVVVIGGGTAGAPAAIAAARQGASVLVVEYQEGLGGVGTLGLIGKPWQGQRRGFAKEVPFPRNIETKMEWYRKEIRKAGGGIWFGALGCGAFVDGKTVKGAVVCTPEGRGVVIARVVIDATGSGDVAIAAGANYMYGTIEKGDIAIQGTGMSSRLPTASYANSDYLLVDESDMVDVWRALASVHLAKRKDYDVVTLIQNRERRRVVGDFVMRYLDQIAKRTYPDSIVLSGSDYDSHGYPSSPIFGLLPHDARSRKANHPAPGGTCYTPYRCLLPRGMDGILVIGLGISMDRDALAMVRMQLDMANQGYAAGVAASMAIKARISPRRINVRSLQQHLIKIGSLPQAAGSHEDSFPLSTDDIKQAVDAYGQSTNPASAGKALAVILTHPDGALRLVKQAYEKAKGKPKLLYAQVLGVLGDKTGVPVLLAALKDVPKWDAKIYQGAMAEYAHLPTPVDSIILALGYAGDRAATPAILKMLDSLDAKVTLSHHRSAAIALERLADPAAAKPLADLLQKPGMKGHAMTSLSKGGKVEERTASLREITLGRALYRCGDHQGLGKKILEQYKTDFRGLFARHADSVLREK